MNGTKEKPSTARRDPSEGSREVVEHELRRTAAKSRKENKTDNRRAAKKTPRP